MASICSSCCATGRHRIHWASSINASTSFSTSSRSTLGFQGRYLLEGSEKLNYLISRLGQEITHARGGRNEFAPNWKLPQRFQRYVRNELPLWLFFALLAVVATAIFFLFRNILGGEADDLTQAQARPALVVPAGENPASSTQKEDRKIPM